MISRLLRAGVVYGLLLVPVIVTSVIVTPVIVTPVLADSIAILPLHHRLPEQVLPTLQPLVEAGGSITGAGNQLFVRTSPANLAELKQVLATLDQPLQRLLISVRQSGQQGSQQQQAGINDVIITDRGVSLDGQLQDSQRNGSSQITQQVQTLDGSAALIRIGNDVPVVQRQIIQGRHGSRIIESTGYQSLNTGFSVLPRVVGDQVTLEIHPQQETLQDGGVARSSVDTTVTGRVGEWMSIGGVSQQGSRQDNALGSASRQQHQGEQTFWLKVDRLP